MKNSSLLYIVGNVELWLSVRSMAEAEVADGEIGQVTHANNGFRPILYGIGIRDDNDIATTQRLQIPALQHRLVAGGDPEHLGKGECPIYGILGTLHKRDQGVGILYQQMLPEEAFRIVAACWRQFSVFLPDRSQHVALVFPTMPEPW